MSTWQERLTDETAPVYPIGVVADALGVSAQVVRRYDDEGVVEPDRSAGGQRRYSRQDVARLAHVLELADEGIPTAGIKRILDLEHRLEAAEQELEDSKEAQPQGSGAGRSPDVDE